MDWPKTQTTSRTQSNNQLKQTSTKCNTTSAKTKAFNIPSSIWQLQFQINQEVQYDLWVQSTTIVVPTKSISIQSASPINLQIQNTKLWRRWGKCKSKSSPLKLRACTRRLLRNPLKTLHLKYSSTWNNNKCPNQYTNFRYVVKSLSCKQKLA